MSTVKIGLIGLGCVGQGLYQLIQGVGYRNAEIKKIAIKNKNKARIVSPELLTFDVDEILYDDEISIIIEAIDDSKDAYEIARKVLVQGKSLISANKKMVAENLEELTSLAQINNAVFRYESAVCGAIPVVQTIDNYFSFEPIHQLRGIFNGTSNYILSKIYNENLSYKIALKQAQELGFAETDPTSDVGGFDAKYKLVILALHAYGLYLHPNEVFNYGIEYITAQDIAYAKEKNLKIKLTPTIYHQDHKIAGFVLPEFIEENDRLYEVENEFNGVNIEGGYAGNQFLYGRGAGAFPTATAVLSDLHHALDSRNYQIPKREASYELIDDAHVFLEIYARYKDENVRKTLAFESVSEGLITPEEEQITGFISLGKLKEIQHLLRQKKVSLIATGKRKIRIPASQYHIQSEAV